MNCLNKTWVSRDLQKNCMEIPVYEKTYKIISFKNRNAPICNNIIVKAFCQTNMSLILNY